MLMSAYLISAIIMGSICAIIAKEKGRSPIGWFLVGLLLSLIGLIIIAVLPRAGKKCLKCAETVLQEAQRCRFCGFEFSNMGKFIEEERNKWLERDSNAREKLSDKQLVDIINDCYNREDFMRCKFYVERLIHEYPQYHPKEVKGTLSEMNRKLGFNKMI